MSSETLVHLVKDFTISTSPSDWIYRKPEELQLSAFPDTSNVSHFVKPISDYIDVQKENERNRSLISFRTLHVSDANGGNQDTRFDFFIDEKLLGYIRGSGKKSASVQLKVRRASTSGNQDEIVPNLCDKRLELTETFVEALKNSKFQHHLFSVNGHFYEHWIVDVIAVWSDRTNAIRLSTDSVMRKLFERESSKDLTIVASNGAKLKCHRIIFEVGSDVLAAMISSINGMKESRTGEIVMDENSEEGMSLLIRYLYGRKLTTEELSCRVSVELFRLAHKYELIKLEDGLCKYLREKWSEWFCPDPLLELYFHVRNLDKFKELERHSLACIMGLSLKIRNCDRFKDLSQTDPAAAMELLWKLFDLSRDNPLK